MVCAPITVARAVQTIPAAYDVTNHMGCAAQIVFVKLINGAVRIIGVADSIIRFLIISASHPVGVIGVIRFRTIWINDIVQIANTSGGIVIEESFPSGFIVDTGNVVVGIINEACQLFRASAAGQPPNRGKLIMNRVCWTPCGRSCSVTKRSVGFCGSLPIFNLLRKKTTGWTGGFGFIQLSLPAAGP